MCNVPQRDERSCSGRHLVSQTGPTASKSVFLTVVVVKTSMTETKSESGPRISVFQYESRPYQDHSSLGEWSSLQLCCRCMARLDIQTRPVKLKPVKAYWHTNHYTDVKACILLHTRGQRSGSPEARTSACWYSIALCWLVVCWFSDK